MAEKVERRELLKRLWLLIEIRTSLRDVSVMVLRCSRFKVIPLLFVSLAMLFTLTDQASPNQPEILTEVFKTIDQILENYRKTQLWVPPADFLPKKSFPKFDFASQGLRFISIKTVKSVETGKVWKPGVGFKVWKVTVQDVGTEIKAAIYLVFSEDSDKMEEACEERNWLYIQSGSPTEHNYGVYRSINPKSYKPGNISQNEYEKAIAWWGEGNWLVFIVVPIQKERRRSGFEKGIIVEERIREKIRDLLCADFKKEGGRPIKTTEEVLKERETAKRFWDNPAIATPYRENISEEEKIAGLAKFWSEVKYNFANFDLVPNLDWDKVFLDYLPKIRQTRSTAEYYRVLMEMCALLKDAHTNVYPPEELEDEFYSRPPIRTDLIEDKVLIVKVDSDDLLHEGIQPGMEIVSIDDIPVKQYAERYVIPYLSSSTKQDLEVRAYSYFLLAGSKDKPVKLGLRDERGNILTKVVPRESYSKMKTRKTQPFEFFEFKVLDGNIAYVALNSFEDASVVKAFDGAFNAIAKTDALIIDLRDNGGGSSDVGWDILGYLTDKPFKTSRWKTRLYRPAYRAWGTVEFEWEKQRAGEWMPNGEKVYRKPVVVLTSPRTFSAAEDFCVAFAYMKRGKIIGEPTGGSTGQPLFFNLPGGGSARVCTKRDSFPDGREFVGVGVQPDILVRPTIADFRKGRDTVLEAALRYLRGK